MMGSCKVALFLTFACIGISSVSCLRCYACSSNSGDEECAKPQDPEHSLYMHCIEVMEDGVCIKLDTVSRGKPTTMRSCIVNGVTCDDIKKEFESTDVELKNCTICNQDLCNGD
ncbi:unnamed protein product [Callosobruchus maculatus]|uniref:Uncharacterized protein n=1 Tax=Callosobruchus maculatus TaxID=64391 RepID=A0A653D595_CALMS|nr:unnamed protein product [Callosobruchus maculatus]